MTPKIHAYGSGFGGISQYVLHDKDADTSKRVEWTETINLGTKNPHVASRVMMATSMDQARLKKEAGVPTQGRKSNKHVMHVTLSWHPEEGKDLTKDEQMRAAKWVLRKLKADDRQTVIVAHNDEPQPHIHMIINRVSTKDGRLLKDYKNYLKTSDFSEQYERERGKIYCHNRVINNAARRRGEYVKGQKDLPRPVYEKMAAVSNDNTQKAAVMAKARQKAGLIAKEQRAVKVRHRSEWQAMETQSKSRRVKMQQQTKLAVIKARQKTRDEFRPKWGEQHQIAEADKAEFNRNEKSLRGRIANAKKLVQWRDLVAKKPDGKRVSTIAGAFRVFGSEGARRDALNKQHVQQEATLKRSQKLAEVRAARKVRAALPAKLKENRRRFEAERSAMITKHRMEKAKIKAAWREHERKRDQSWSELQTDTKDAALKQRAEAWKAGKGKKTNPSDLLPREGSTKAAMQIDSYAKQVSERARHNNNAANENQRDSGRGGDDRGR